ncbi:helix-turn-helix domain-containing protein [Fulvimarina endophytica]|uniref:helix-turn-helix domain-containing protein n=1 Tax=Fulvimarina endophytica TaxID=2293836 RepID=UPI001FE1A494|nr:helix-turn-helix domain-containing protein [Fulvimarina endophytica]
MNAIQTITAEIAAIRGVSVEDIVSNRRPRRVIRPRQEAMYFAQKLTPASLPAIGRHLGGRDHSTVMHGIRRIEQQCASVTGYAGELETIEQRLKLALPGGGAARMLPAEDLDIAELARRIDAAVRAGETVRLYIDEVAAMAARIVDLESRIGAIRAAISGLEPIQINIVETPDLPQTPVPVIVETVAPLRAAAEAAVKSWGDLQSRRFSRLERAAQQAFDRDFAVLKTLIERS